MSRRPPNVIVVSAPSGAGKSTVLGRVLHELQGIRFSVSHTTRPPRPGESDGVQYHFVTGEAFGGLIRKDLLLEWADVHDHRYGTARSEYEQAVSDGVDLLLDLDVQGAAQIRMKLPDAVSVFIFPPSYQDLEKRLRGRGHEDEKTIGRRLDAAFEEMSLFTEYDYAVVNDDLDRCVQDLKAVIGAARCRTSRLEGPAGAILESFKKEK